MTERWTSVAAIVSIVAGTLLMAAVVQPAGSGTGADVRPLWEQRQPISGLAWDGHSLWMTLDGEATICQVNPRTGAVGRRLTFVSPDTAGSAFDGRFLWQLAYKDRTIHRIDLGSGRSVGTIPAPGKGGCSGLTYDGRHLWAASFDDARIYQIDQTQGGRVLRSVPGLFESTGLAWDGEHLWHGILVGAKEHDAAPPQWGFIEQRDLWRDATLRVLPLPGVGPGTAEWLPGQARATSFWWYDGYNRRVVRVALPQGAGKATLAAPLALIGLGLCAVAFREWRE
jgi:hypothetical protein